MRSTLLVVGFALALVLPAACGPSAEEIATQTAAAWTATPLPTSTPTATPTPIPYDLTVSVVDGDGNPVPGAFVSYPESGDDEPVAVDESGMVSWAGMSSEIASLEVSAQGYYTQAETLTLTRGPNEFAFAMERDPLQLLAAEACPGDQEAIYLEDFEDGFAQGMEGIGRPLWEFVTDEERGTYLAGENQQQNRLTVAAASEAENYVVQFDALRPPDANVLWIRVRENEGKSYIAVFLKNGQTFLQREGPNEPAWPARYLARPDGETWQHISVSVFEGDFDLWLDDELLLGVSDPDPYGPGELSIEITGHESVFALDNLAICALQERYEAPVVEAEATE